MIRVKHCVQVDLGAAVPEVKNALLENYVLCRLEEVAVEEEVQDALVEKIVFVGSCRRMSLITNNFATTEEINEEIKFHIDGLEKRKKQSRMFNKH